MFNRDFHPGNYGFTPRFPSRPSAGPSVPYGHPTPIYGSPRPPPPPRHMPPPPRDFVPPPSLLFTAPRQHHAPRSHYQEEEYDHGSSYRHHEEEFDPRWPLGKPAFMKNLPPGAAPPPPGRKIPRSIPETAKFYSQGFEVGPSSRSQELYKDTYEHRNDYRPPRRPYNAHEPHRRPHESYNGPRGPRPPRKSGTDPYPQDFVVKKLEPEQEDFTKDPVDEKDLRDLGEPSNLSKQASNVWDYIYSAGYDPNYDPTQDPSIDQEFEQWKRGGFKEYDRNRGHGGGGRGRRGDEDEDGDAKRPRRGEFFEKYEPTTCPVCEMTLDGKKSYQLHIEGKKHKSMVAAQVPHPEFICMCCNVMSTSKQQFEVHLKGKKHAQFIEAAMILGFKLDPTPDESYHLAKSVNAAVKVRTLKPGESMLESGSSSSGIVPAPPHGRTIQITPVPVPELGKHHYRCDICQAPMQGYPNLQKHMKGKVHKHTVEHVFQMDPNKTGKRVHSKVKGFVRHKSDGPREVITLRVDAHGKITRRKETRGEVPKSEFRITKPIVGRNA